nr:MAG TPA: hypothetical protein [Caudoviricetes sp.]
MRASEFLLNYAKPQSKTKNHFNNNLNLKNKPFYKETPSAI